MHMYTMRPQCCNYRLQITLRLAQAYKPAGSKLRICSFCVLLSCLGKVTSYLMMRLPRCPGCRLIGMPSPLHNTAAQTHHQTCHTRSGTQKACMPCPQQETRVGMEVQFTPAKAALCICKQTKPAVSCVSHATSMHHGLQQTRHDVHLHYSFRPSNRCLGYVWLGCHSPQHFL